MKTYLIYYLRWQISALIMILPMMFLESLGLALWLNLMIGQFIGAIIFWNADKWIFKKENK